MVLEQYLRLEINYRIYPVLKGDKCEICGAMDNLELHHVEQFIKMLDSTLLGLGLDYKDTDDYSEIELENIKHIMIGKHFTHPSITVCDKCHDELHRQYGRCSSQIKEVDTNWRELNKVKRTMLLTEKEKYHIHNVLIPYLNSVVGEVMLTKEDRTELIERINLIDGNHSNFKTGQIKYVQSIDSLNEYLNENDIPYLIKNFETSRIVDGKKKKFKNAWKVMATLASSTV